MKNLMIVAFLLSGCAGFLLSGCVSSSLKSNVEPNAISIGMSESEFLKEYGNLGEKLVYSNTDMSSFLWILNTGSERVWLTGNAFLGGTATTKHHTLVVSFNDNKVSKVSSSSMNAHDKKRLDANRYKGFYWLSESLNTCKSYLSIQDRGRYAHLMSEIVNSWVYSPDVFDLIDQYNKNHANLLSPQGQTQCSDATVYFEKASNEFAQRN
jgi:hypothetical protein